MDNWINCKDRLPEQRIRVLTWEGLIVLEAYIDFDESWKWSNKENDTIETVNITHWMPLPEPPNTNQ